MKTKISQSEARLKVVTGKNSLTNLANEVYNSLSEDEKKDDFEPLYMALKPYFKPQSVDFRSIKSTTMTAMWKNLDFFQVSNSPKLEIFCIDFFVFKNFPKMTEADLYSFELF